MAMSSTEIKIIILPLNITAVLKITHNTLWFFGWQNDENHLGLVELWVVPQYLMEQMAKLKGKCIKL